jgi:peroxiredoxin
MIEEGEHAPGFELPAIVDGEETTAGIDEQLGDGVTVLAFYPGDFNPACTDETTGLDELDLFQMQKDVSVLAISTDSVYSHRAFAGKYDLRVPLLADVTGGVAADYGVAVGDEQAGYGAHRAVVVVDHTGTVEYAWHSEDPTELPPTDEIREAVEGVGGREVASARYRIGHAHYIEGRRAFTSAMNEFEAREWTLAQGDFRQAESEFETATDEFDTAARFAEDERTQTYYERATEKANALWQAAEWLADSASSFASGEGAAGESMRADARTPLETAQEIHEPPAPDEFPPEEDPAAADDGSFLPGEDDGPPATLEMNFDEEMDDSKSAAAGQMEGDAQAESAKQSERATTGDRSKRAEQTRESEKTEDSEEAPTEIDEEELEEITAELEEQSEEIEEQREQSDESDTTTDVSGSLAQSSPATLEPATDSSDAERKHSTDDSEATLDPSQSESGDSSDTDAEKPSTEGDTHESVFDTREDEEDR